MGNGRVTKIAALLIVVASGVLAPGTATARGNKDRYAVPARRVVPMQSIELSPRGLDSMYIGCFYTLPIQAVYQCPAVLADQPGSQVEFLKVNTTAGLLGGQPWLYHR
jgi:hypothetical protein